MMGDLKHVIGISGGKDSAALAIYLNKLYPQLDLIYYFCDTGKELDETYQLIENLEIYLGKKVTHLKSEDAEKTNENPFDHYYKAYRGYLPSSVARWCTKQMKLDPFEKFVGEDPVVSYVGIRGDEDREGYISRKSNIQSIFPFRKNIWSEDVLQIVLSNESRERLIESYSKYISGTNLDKVAWIVKQTLQKNPGKQKTIIKRHLHNKLDLLLNNGITIFNHVVFDMLKETEYPLAKETVFPLLDNEEDLNREDIFEILEDSGVGIPAYYKKVEFEVNGEVGEYARSRSGCYFCFFQQKIEWVWLYEQHPDLFIQAQHYEKIDEGFTWNQDESLEDLIQPRRLEQIKMDHIKRSNKDKSKDSSYLIDILDDTEGESCVACFV